MTAPAKVIELIDLFQRNAEAYCGGHYNETQVREEFINPLFKCLGWDMDNAQGYAEAYKDLIHEDAIKIGGANKAPDYCFRIGGARKFFLEAKKPAINLKDDPAPAYQLRRYAWSAKLPLSILTSFAELAVYDCRIKPAQTDKASVGRLLYVTTADLAARWDELAGIFAREAVLKGSFDKYADTAKGKKGTATVDAAFLQEIEGWREMLAKNLAVRNPQLSQRELNYAVQVTIDRIIFLRMCEDRGIERYGQLLGLVNGPSIYGRLKEVFQSADERYNSGLFHFHKEKDQAEDPDELTPSLAIDDKQLKDIIQGLYYPESPYEFSVLSAEILGQVYEQFLGKVIRLTAGHQAKVEDKPEVKKAGGVYYTPAYIVDYIVKNTVGKLLEGKTPRQVSKLRVLDPACGSGSFLLGAYRCLHDWHRDCYVEDGPPKHTKELYQGPGGGWRLTTAEKKRILLNNIYGADIDPQAVEVTKLSLLLKVLEGESQQTLERQFKLFHERALPDLASNIKCGNSLIGPDFYDGQQVLQFDDEERYRVNAFDWNAGFPKVITAGGFDAVIGNPPYIRIQTLQDTNPLQPPYLRRHYHAASSGNYDVYVVFVEKGFSLLSGSGHLGMILPSKFFATDYGERLREQITGQGALSAIVDFGHAQVFHTATTYTCLLFLAGTPTASVSYVKVPNPAALAHGDLAYRTIPSTTLGASPWAFSTDAEQCVIDKLLHNSVPLGQLPSRIGRGSSSGADDVFILQRRSDGIFTRHGAAVEIESEILRTPIYATDFGRFHFNPSSGEAIIFPYDVHTDGYELKSEPELRNRFPAAYAYLASRKEELQERKQFRAWYGFSAPRNLEVHDRAHMLVPLLADRGLYCRLPEPANRYCLMASGGFSITVSIESRLSPDYVLGLLNSRLMFWRLRSISNVFRGGWITCTKQYVETLPVQRIDLTSAASKAGHDRIAGMVSQVASLQNNVAAARTPHDKNVLQTQIAATDRQIDQLVYELYDLTEAEIGIVEEGMSR